MKRDEQKWQVGIDAQKGDGYGLAVFAYAERWADLMEQAIADGEQLEYVASELSHTADTDGITGFMYGCAVSVLYQTWQYGEQLRCWHNLSLDRDQGALANSRGTVLNPAIITVAVE